MAQLVAHLHGMQGVRGSSPLRSTNKKKSVSHEALFFVYARTSGALSRWFQYAPWFRCRQLR